MLSCSLLSFALVSCTLERKARLFVAAVTEGLAQEGEPKWELTREVGWHMVPISAAAFLRRAASPPPSTGDNLATGAARIAASKPPLIVMSSSCVNEGLTCHLGIHAPPLPKKRGRVWVGGEWGERKQNTHK